MKFTIEKRQLAKALQKVQGIVNKHQLMPILSNVLLEATETSLYISATDLEVAIRISCSADVISSGKVAVSGKRLHKLLKELPDKSLSFSCVSGDWIDIDCGNIRLSLDGASVNEFPSFPPLTRDDLFEVETGILHDMIDKTFHAASNDPSKSNLNGIYIKAEIDLDGRKVLKMVATDGHRLSITSRDFAGTFCPKMETGVIVPNKGLLAIRKMASEPGETLRYGFIDNNIVIGNENDYLIIRLIDGGFPNYNQVIPRDILPKVTINKDILYQSLRRMTIHAMNKEAPVKLDISFNSILVSSDAYELGTMKERIIADYDGDSVVAKFNAKYLMDILSVTENKQIEMKTNKRNAPWIISPKDSDSLMCIIMPLTL